MTTVSFADNGTIVPINIAKCERHYNGVFVGDFCLKDRKGGWVNDPVAVFWIQHPTKPEYSNYLGIFVREDEAGNSGMYLTDGQSAFCEGIDAIVGSDGEVLYSRYRHDFRSLKDGSGCIDGGRDYTRTLSGANGELPTIYHLTVSGPVFNMTEVPRRPKLSRPIEDIEITQMPEEGLDAAFEIAAALAILREKQ